MIEPRAARRQTDAGKTLSIVLGGGELAPAHVRAAIDGFAGDLDSEQLALLKLLISELVTNSILHGGAGPTDRIHVQVTVSAERLHAEVSDSGAGFSCAGPPVPREVGGFGLVIVDRTASRWGTTRGGRRVWFELDRGQPDSRSELGGDARATGRLHPRRRGLLRNREPRPGPVPDQLTPP